MTVIEIIEKYLKENGYDGLYNERYECGCEIGDLAPCGEIGTDCKAGYKRPCEEYGWCIGEKKAGD